MSGSFWKFGQDYSAESPISRVLNGAFIRRGNDLKNNDNTGEISKTSNESEEDNSQGDLEGNDSHDEENSLPTTESDSIHFKPNLEILEDLLDDEELYTELMCSNFKLLVYLKYPEVLSKLIDYVTSETIMKEGAEGPEGPVLPNELHADTEAVIEGTEASTQKALETDLGEVRQSEDAQIADSSQEAQKPEHKEIDQREKLKKEKGNVQEQEKEDEKKGDNDEEEEEKDVEVQDEDSTSEPSEETSVTLPPETEEQVESRRACMAAEILSADVWPISSAIMDNREILDRLWSILDRTTPLSIVTSTYFMKINERLLDMDITGMMEFILMQDNVVDRFLNHVDNPPLMDFLLKVISADKPDSPTGIIDVLKTQSLIPQLLDHLGPDYSAATQSAAGDFLKAFVTISANSNNELASGIGPNELTRQLVSPDMMEKLIKIMLKGGTSLSNGVGIIIELIRKNNSDYDFVQVVYTTLETHPPNDRDPVYLGHLVKLFARYMPEFNKILVETKLPQLETPFGSIEPLGFERFKICELVAELLHCSNMTLINEPSGEAIVHERDVERVRLLNLQRKQRQTKGDTSQLDTYAPNDQGSISDSQDENEFNIDDTKEMEVKGQSDDQALGNSSKRSADQIEFEEKNVSEKLASLQIENSGNDSYDTTDDYEGNSTVENDAEIHSEGESSDSEITEKALRENPIVGDQLKIALHDTSIIKTILNMFFRFAWNNFLHNVVFDIVQQIFNGPLKTGYNRFLLADLLVDTNITKMIMEGDQKCSDYEKETGLRLGYMGHLTLIAEEVAKFSAYIEEMKITFSNPAIWESLNETHWKEYTETVLADTREKYNTVLGDFADEEDEVNHDDMISEHDVDDEEDDSGYHSQTYDFNFNRPNSYRGFLESTGNEDEEDATYNDSEDSRYYEYMNGDGTKTRLELEPSLDYDIPDDHTSGELLDTHDSTSDDNQFTNYMSHQLVRGFTAGDGNDDVDSDEERMTSTNKDDASDKTKTGKNDKNESSINGEMENEDAWTTGGFSFNGGPTRSLPSNPEIYTKNVFQHQFELEGVGDDDDYMDPNDDGQSYAKPNHPLYSNIITPTASHRQSSNSFYDKVLVHGNDDDLSDDSDAELEEEISGEEDNMHVASDEEQDDESYEGEVGDRHGAREDKKGNPNDDGYTLFRSKSKDNLSWDKDEQERLMEMADYNRKQNSNK